MRRHPCFVVFWCLGTFVLAWASQSLLAQGMFEGVSSRIYAGLAFSYVNVSGNKFDGNHVLMPQTDYVPIPKLEAAKGFGVVLGFRGENIGIELSYYYHRHNATLIDPTLQSITEKVGNHNLNIDFKGHFWPGSRLEGYYQAGLVICFITMDKAIFGNVNDELKILGDVTFQGAGLDFGLGLDFWLIPELGVTAGVFYRRLFFTTLKESFYDSSAEMDALNTSISGVSGQGLGVIVGILVNLK